MPIVNRALAKSLPRMVHAGAVAADNRHRAGPTRTTRSRPAQRVHTEYTAPSSRTSARGVTVASVVASDANGGGASRKLPLLLGEARADRLPGRIARGVEPRIHAAPAARH